MCDIAAYILASEIHEVLPFTAMLMRLLHLCSALPQIVFLVATVWIAC